ncbi:hypothetical protein DFH28DRAFT_934405 [Melampsora americana]|nr:hypothetical protein DFH28DRAFT_934405 [Melampsora americana]
MAKSCTVSLTPDLNVMEGLSILQNWMKTLKWDKRKKVETMPNLRSSSTMMNWVNKLMGIGFGGVLDVAGKEAGLVTKHKKAHNQEQMPDHALPKHELEDMIKDKDLDNEDRTEEASKEKFHLQIPSLRKKSKVISTLKTIHIWV